MCERVDPSTTGAGGSVMPNIPVLVQGMSTLRARFMLDEGSCGLVLAVTGDDIAAGEGLIWSRRVPTKVRSRRW